VSEARIVSFVPDLFITKYRIFFFLASLFCESEIIYKLRTWETSVFTEVNSKYQYMKVVLIASAANKHDLDYRASLQAKIEAIGAEVIYLKPKQLIDKEADVVAVLLDGHDIASVDAARIGAFRQWADSATKLPKPIVVGYDYAKGSDAELKASGWFTHIAETERNFIYCLKDYIFIQNKHK